MAAKRLEDGSEYAEYDADGDGIVTDEELQTSRELRSYACGMNEQMLNVPCHGSLSGACCCTQALWLSVSSSG